MRFEKYRISDEIKENLNQMGFHKTTDIQFKVIPPIMKGEDVLAIAQTGTGKTAAFAIPIVNELQITKKKKGLRALVLAPTRELAQQIGGVFAQISKGTGVRTFAIYGGVEQDPQIEQLIGGMEILIASPGRMFDLISQGYIDTSKVDILVLDEADHMLDLGFIKDIESVKRKLKQHHQTLFFSATINAKIKKLAYSQIKSDALRIQISPENKVSKNITHGVVHVSMENKRHLLTNFLKSKPEAKVLVFVRTKVRAERVCKHLTKNNFLPQALHGGMNQNEREDSLSEFRSGESGVLIASDLSARGIDLPGISHVINYDLPDDPENYVHRVGRTGRAFAKGDAVSFCSPEELNKLEDVEKFIGAKVTEWQVDESFVVEDKKVDVESLEVHEILAMEEAFYEKSKKKK